MEPHLIEFETPRLWLRKFTLEDAEAAYQMNRDPEVTRYIVGEGKVTLEQTRQLIQHNTLADYAKYGYGRLAIVHKADHRFIGFTGLKFLEDLQEVDVGYRLHRDYWGMGLATEATRPTIDFGFNQLELNRIIALALPDNRASIRVMEKMGMQFEKTITEEGQEAVQYVLRREKWSG